MTISNRAKNISPSLTLAITAKAAKMKADGKDIVTFTAGEPDFNTPDYIVAAAKLAMDKGLTRYTASSGILPLKEAICQKLKKDNHLTYAPNQIVVSNGAKHSLYNAFMAILNEGDEVLIPAPYWLTYPELVTLCGAIPKFITPPASNNFKLTPDVLKASITKKTKAIVFNNPSNPTGVVYTKGEIQALAQVLEAANIYVIADDIYEKLIYDNLEFYSIAQFSDKLKQNTIVVNGLSKAFAMTGWRIGYTASTPELAKAMDNIQSHTTSNANTIAQYASVAALTDRLGDAFLSDSIKLFDSRRQLMITLLEECKPLTYVRPNGAFYVMVDMAYFVGKTLMGKNIQSAADFAELLIEHAHLVTIPCESFGAPTFIRLSYCIDEAQIKKGLTRLKSFVAEVVS